MAQRLSYWTRGFLALLFGVFLIPSLLMFYAAGPTEVLLIGLVLMLPLFLVRWVFVDAWAREMSAWTWAVFAYAITFVTVPIYLVIRVRHPA